MFLAHYGYDLFPTLASYKEITIVVEQNTPENVAYSPWIGLVGAYDIDANDTLTVNILPPSHGSVLLTATTTSTPSLPQACNGNEIAEALPCDVSLAHGEASYSWKLTTLVYTPDSQYYGMDEFRVIIEDSGGKYSDILKVTVAVAENPCVSNSTCVGQTDDIDCTATKRATVGFLNEYSCACLPGWTGDTCDTDFDECSSAPCIYPYACFDKFNGYECGCPPDWLICDSGLTPLTVGLIAIIFILICVVIGFVVWYKRSKLKVVLGDLMPVGGTKAYYNIDTKQRRTLNMANKGDGYSREVPIWTTTSAKKSKALEAGILDDDVTPPCTPSTGRARRPESVDFAVRTPEPPPTVRMTTTQIDTETEEAPSPVYFNKATPAAKNVDKAESKKLLKLWKEMKARKLPSTPEPSSPTPTPTPKKTRIQSISIARLKKKPSRPESSNSTVSKKTGRESALSVSSTVSSDTMPGSMGGDI
ncbi:uncharacterized protein LOC135496571 [Lineus longissimus]|uniref:uncharacterized protein LOC135496571 n=1 Tax=Lineus longissimus TaxID=88925 RepID=UPI00315D6BAA